MNKINEIIDHFGSQTALAEKLNVTPQAVQQWVADNEIPIKRCVDIEHASSGKFTRNEIRPEIFGSK